MGSRRGAAHVIHQCQAHKAIKGACLSRFAGDDDDNGGLCYALGLETIPNGRRIVLLCMRPANIVMAWIMKHESATKPKRKKEPEFHVVESDDDDQEEDESVNIPKKTQQDIVFQFSHMQSDDPVLPVSPLVRAMHVGSSIADSSTMRREHRASAAKTV